MGFDFQGRSWIEEVVGCVDLPGFERELGSWKEGKKEGRNAA